MTDSRFTLEEAQALVPWLQETFDALEPLKAELARSKERVQSLMTRIQSNGGARAEAELEEATRAQYEAEDRIDEHAYAIVERGILIRSLDRGWSTSRLCATAAGSISAGWLGSRISRTGKRWMRDSPGASLCNLS